MKSRPKVKTDLRRDQIAQSALRIIAKSGVKGLTTSALARGAGISEANLYRHFKSKDEIVALTAEKIGEGLQRNLEKVYGKTSSESPLEKLRKIYKLHLNYIEENEGIPRLVYSEEIHSGNRELKQKFLHSISSYSKAIESLVREAQKAGLIRKEIDAGASALMIIGMVQATVLRWSLSGFLFSLTKEGMKLWKNFEKSVVNE